MQYPNITPAKCNKISPKLHRINVTTRCHNSRPGLVTGTRGHFSPQDVVCEVSDAIYLNQYRRAHQLPKLDPPARQRNLHKTGRLEGVALCIGKFLAVGKLGLNVVQEVILGNFRSTKNFPFLFFIFYLFMFVCDSIWLTFPPSIISFFYCFFRVFTGTFYFLFFACYPHCLL